MNADFFGKFKFIEKNAKPFYNFSGGKNVPVDSEK
jgi:hypothetical protein